MATKKQVSAKVVKAPIKSAAKKITPVKPIPKKAVPVAHVVQTKKIVGKKAVQMPALKKASTVANKKTIDKKPVKGLLKVVPVQVKKTVTKSAKPIPVTKSKIVASKKITKAKPVVIIKKPTALKNVSVKTVEPVKKIMAKKEETTRPVAIDAPEKALPIKPAAEAKVKTIKVPAVKPMVLPKITTKTVRKYQPEFTKSVLDKVVRDPGAPSQRYSDGELQEFRELIQRKLEAAKKELSYLTGLITRKDELGGDEGDNRYMTMEDGSLSMEREQLSQMASRQITFIDHLEKAVMRIENKTYGICRVTGKLIDKARLRAVPHATLSIEAKMGSGK